MRAAWIAFGLTCTGLGLAGIVLPLLPGTPFLLIAAYAFARSSPRLYDWLLGLPRIGPAIRGYRAGLGVPRRVKLYAVTVATAAVSVSALNADSWLVRLAVIGLGVVGMAYVLFAVPTRALE